MDLCGCGVRVYEYTDYTKNQIVKECIQRYTKRGKSCNFYQTIQFAPPPVFEIPIHLDKLHISEDVKKFRELLDSNTLDRNMIIWYVLNKDVGIYVEDAKKKINEIDKILIGKLRGMLLVMKNAYHFSFSIVHELFDFLKRYVGVSEDELGHSMSGMLSGDGVQMITQFYQKMHEIADYLENVGFEYVPPVFGGIYNAPKQIDSKSLIEKRGIQLPPLILEDGIDNDLFESDEEDNKNREESEEEESDCDEEELDVKKDYSDMDSGEEETDSGEEETDSEDSVNKKLIKKLSKGLKRT